jgi:outer membrane receptor protein involved in Fe transport
MCTTNSRKHLRLLSFCLLVSVMPKLPVEAQTQAATLRGVVQDRTEKAVANAAVTLTNIAQQRSWKTVTNEVGVYNLVQIPPGDYDLAVELDQFKKYQQRGLTLEVAQVAELNVTMDVGSVTEVVSVTANAPLLESATSTLGEVVNSRAAESLPLNGRNILELIQLVPGVNAAPNFRNSLVAAGTSDSVSFNINGGRNFANMIMLDGSPQEVPAFNQAAFVPSPDAIQEFRVQTNSMPAEYGRTSGGVINIIQRSGTRDFHGTAYEFLRNDKLDANNFFSNRNGRARAPFRYNQFGFTLGGPLTPSRKNTFFFLNYEGVRQVNAGATTYTVPTERMRRGDFSELSTLIYDPRTIDAAGTRQAFTGNMIPTNRIDPVALKLVSYYPLPNLPGVANNYFSQIGSRPSGDLFTVKIDRRISEHNNVFGRFSWSNYTTLFANDFGNVASPNAGAQQLRTRSATLDDTHVAGKWVLHGNLGWAYFASPRNSPPEEVLPSSLGFPAFLDAATQFHIFPTIQPSGFATLGGNAFWIIGNEFETHNLNLDASRVIGRHTVKFGGSYRLNRVSVRQPISPAGLYNFDPTWTQQTFNRGGGGNTMASMLLGLPASGQLQQEPYLATQVKYGALFAQTDWRVNPRLTLNLGLRWDTDRPLTERYDRASSFDPTAVLPIQPPGLGQIRGGLVFAGRNGQPRGIRNPDNNNFAPRVGLAYKLTDRLVIRSAGSILYAGTTGDGPSTGRIGGLGFNAITTVTASQDGGRTPFATLQNPFPNGLTTASNGKDGLLTFLGTDTFAVIRSDRIPYLGQWNLDVQYELPRDGLLDVAYAGNVGVKLLGTDPELNQLPDQYLSLGSALTQTVPNPFFGIIPATQPLGGATITRGQLLRPFPQFGSIQQQKAAEFHSSYHALQTKFRQRFHGGVQFLVAYTWSKLIDNGSSVGGFAGQQNPGYTNFNRKDLDRSISALDVAHRLVINYQWELPFGNGKRFLGATGILDKIVGGWSLNGITTAQSGLPISITSLSNTTNSFGGTQRPNSTGISSVTPGDPVDRLNGWFNPSAFQAAPAFTFGNVGRFLPDNRGPGILNWDAAILKTTTIHERFRMQLRGEFFNLFNHPNFRNPSGAALQFGQPSFGTITVADPGRSVQLGLKLLF